MLDGFDEDAHKYKEATTGGIHTKERCQEAKAKLKQSIGPAPTTEYLEKLEQKNDHGNENQSSTPTVKGWIPTKEQADKIAEETKNYVDHTQQAKGHSKLKLFFGLPSDVENDYNNFLATNNGKIKTQGAQFQMTKDDELEAIMFAIALYYEEVMKQ
jgi:hypothetical protein